MFQGPLLRGPGGGALLFFFGGGGRSEGGGSGPSGEGRGGEDCLFGRIVRVGLVRFLHSTYGHCFLSAACKGRNMGE